MGVGVDEPEKEWPDSYPPVPRAAPGPGLEAGSRPGSSESGSEFPSSHATKHGTVDARRWVIPEAWDGSGRFVVCETALEGVRVYRAAFAAGLKVLRRVDVVPKVGKPTLF